MPISSGNGFGVLVVLTWLEKKGGTIFFFLGEMSAFLLVNPEQCRSMQPKTVYKAGFAIGQKIELACRQ